MKIQRSLIILTVANLLLLTFNLAHMQPVVAQSSPGVLRGTGLEIVDAQGRIRAMIGLLPEDQTYPETVILRLIDREGKPTVKVTTQEEKAGYPKGSGIVLLGDSDATQAHVGARGATSKVELKNTGGQSELITP